MEEQTVFNFIWGGGGGRWLTYTLGPLPKPLHRIPGQNTIGNLFGRKKECNRHRPFKEEGDGYDYSAY